MWTWQANPYKIGIFPQFSTYWVLRERRFPSRPYLFIITSLYIQLQSCMLSICMFQALLFPHDPYQNFQNRPKTMVYPGWDFEALLNIDFGTKQGSFLRFFNENPKNSHIPDLFSSRICVKGAKIPDFRERDKVDTRLWTQRVKNG